MTTISITKLYDLLTPKVGKEAAENITTYIEEKVVAELESRSGILATKSDISDVRKEIAEGKTDVIKWMFIFWIGQVAATFGFIILFLKK